MSSGVEHLYHDAAISNNFTALEAKDKLKTRQQQARVEKQLERFHRTLERAHTVLIKRQDWEKNSIEQDLSIIKLKSPSLNKGLKREENSKVKKLPSITKSSNSLVNSFLTECASSDNSSKGKKSSSRPASLKWPDIRYSAEVLPMHPEDSNPNDTSETVYMKKANVVTRNLHRLYKRKQERLSYIQEAAKVLKNNQQLFPEKKDMPPSSSQKKLSRKNTDNETVDGISISSRNSENQEGCLSPHGEVESFDEGLRSNSKVDNTHFLFRRYSNVSTPGSSVLANASDTDSEFDDKHNKWTDIFRIPEMWKVFDGRKKIQVITEPAPPALMTIRGKLRKTLLK